MTGNRAPHVVVWQYDVIPGRQAAFEAAYGPDGDWVRLFRLAPAYVVTLLLRDRTSPSRYATVDVWTDEASYDAFLMEHRAEYDAIDERCAALTRDEVKGWGHDLVG